MIRVLEVLALSAGGIGRHVAALVERMDGNEVRVDIAAPPDMTIPMPKEPLPLRIPAGVGPDMFRAQKDLRALIEAGRYDVVHAHGLRAALVALKAAVDTPVVVTLHNLIRAETSGHLRSVVFRRGETAVLRKARRVFAVSEEMAVALTERAPRYAAKIELLRIGLPEPRATRSSEEVRTELGAQDRALIVTVARLARQKSLDVLLHALVDVDDAVLAIVGEGPLESELRDLSRRLGISERVRFLGWREEVGDYLHAADAFALSSTWEARALAVQEAILAETPVVSTAVGGMPELIEDGRSGLLVPPNEPKLLAAALVELIGYPDQARRYAQNAKAALTAGYSDDAMVARVRREYEETAGV